MPQLFSHRGERISTGKHIGSGGEGAVYEVVGNPSVVAKLYHADKQVSAAKQRKLSAMANSASPDILKFAAWPISTLHASQGSAVVGIVMPRVGGATDIHQLYSPAQRRALFPLADWQFLLRVARNCAAVISTLHDRRIVIGDINQGNVLVTDKAVVNLIDCDSFQFAHNGETFLCEVGVPHFTPPELHKAKFNATVRTPNHDCFGLALLVFHLLFVGRHPFAGRFAGRGDMPIEKAIPEFRYAYSRSASAWQMSPPPSSLSPSRLPPQIVDYLERAFTRGSDSPGARPTAAQWVAALDSLEKSLEKCDDDPGHVYPKLSTTCPWCEIEHAGGPNFFISVTLARYTGPLKHADEKALWAAIAAITFPEMPYHPAPRSSAAAYSARPLPADVADRRLMQQAVGWVAAVSASLMPLGTLHSAIAMATSTICLVFTIWWIVLFSASPTHRVRSERKHALRKAAGDLYKLQTDLAFKLSNFRNEFQKKRVSLENTLGSVQSLERDRIEAQQRLHASIQERQLQAHLDSHLIENARIKGIGEGRLMTLMSTLR